MGEIIQFNHKNENNSKTVTFERKKYSIRKWVGILITVFTTFCTITGITILTLVEKDWQEIAEQYNDDGLELYNLGKYEEAIALYDNAIKLENRNINDIDICYYNRGRAYFKLGDYQKAIGDYTIAIEISPKSKYYSERAVTYEKIGETEKAASDNFSAFITIIE